MGIIVTFVPAAGVRITLHASLASQEAHAVRGATHLPRKTGSWAGGVCGQAGKPARSRRLEFKKAEGAGGFHYMPAVHQDGMAEKKEAVTAQPEGGR